MEDYLIQVVVKRSELPYTTLHFLITDDLSIGSIADKIEKRFPNAQIRTVKVVKVKGEKDNE